jgi:tRNA (mo5U34)-methyltransferase
MNASSPSSLSSEIERLGPWFHNLTLPGGMETAPNHHFGDFPRFKWEQIAPHVPGDLSGKRVLDIGCNAGFYTFELAKRGAVVTGLDIDDHYLRQARWAADRLGLADRVRFRRGSVYEVAALEETFDIVVFMGVFYHLRYPLLALDGLAALRPELMIFQSLTYGDPEAAVPTDGARFQDRHRLDEPGWPKMAFIETEFSGDPTNWWVPNRAAVLALLRTAGFRVEAEPGDEIFLCRHDPANRRGYWDEAEFSLARGAATS